MTGADAARDASVQRTLGVAAAAGAATAAAIGLVAMAGWATSTPELTRPFLGATTTRWNEATCVVLLALALASGRRLDGRGVVLTPLLAGAAALIGAATLVEHAVGAEGGFDEWAVHDTTSGRWPGRMSVLAALTVVVVAAAVGTLRVVIGPRVRALLAVVALTLAAVPLLSFLYGGRELFEGGSRASMSFGAALALTALAAGALAMATPERVRTLVARRDPIGTRTRALMVVAPLVVVVIGLVQARLIHQRDADPALVHATTTLLLLGAMAVALGWIAERLMGAASARQEAEAQRDLALQRLAAILDEAPAIVYLRDGQGRFVSGNRSFLQLVSRTSTDLADLHDEEVFGDAGARLRAADLAALEGGGTRGAREHLRVVGEAERVFQAIRFPVDDGPDGRRVLCVIATDVTDRERLEGRLIQAERMEAIGRLAGGVAHDFNNLITVINGAAELGLLQTTDDELRRELAAILDAGQRGAGLARQLLAFGRRGGVDPRLLRFQDMASGLTRLLQHTLGADVELAVRVDDGLPPVLADQASLEQALIQLAANARQALGNGGKVRVEATFVRVTEASSAGRAGAVPGPYVRISVADNGSGMTTEVAARAFEPFFTTWPDSTGLGLSTVYGTVHQAGGHVELSSELGLGTVVRLLLPAAPTDQAAPATPVGAPMADRPRPRLLVVEDDPAVRAITVRVLGNAGFDFIEAEDADDALAALRGKGSHFDLLITDLVMPDMSGVLLVERARELVPGLRVVIMSGYTPALIEPQLGERLRDRVVALEKPFTRDQLLAAVEEALR